jgi:hypothetical protein
MSTGRISPVTRKNVMQKCADAKINMTIFDGDELAELYGPTLNLHPSFLYLKKLQLEAQQQEVGSFVRFSDGAALDDLQ